MRILAGDRLILLALDAEPGSWLMGVTVDRMLCQKSGWSHARVKRLVRLGLVEKTPDGSVRISMAGRQIAATL